jgi:hypothetical protein
MEITLTQIQKLLKDWHEAGREDFEVRYNNGGHFDSDYWKWLKEKRKYVNLNEGASGAFILDKTTGEIFQIKGYGVPNRKKLVGHISTITGTDLHKHDFYYRKNKGK